MKSNNHENQLDSKYRNVDRGSTCVRYMQTKLLCLSIVIYEVWNAVRCVRHKGEFW